MIFKKAKKLIISTIDLNRTKLTKDSLRRANKNSYRAKQFMAASNNRKTFNQHIHNKLTII
jgi:hypothetical protein